MYQVLALYSDVLVEPCWERQRHGCRQQGGTRGSCAGDTAYLVSVAAKRVTGKPRPEEDSQLGRHPGAGGCWGEGVDREKAPGRNVLGGFGGQMCSRQVRNDRR